MYFFQIFYYSTDLFVNVGLTQEEASYATLSVGCIMVVMTFISVPLMDSLGRKTLHLTGLSGMFVLSIVFTIAFKFAAEVRVTSVTCVVEKTIVCLSQTNGLFGLHLKQNSEKF